MHRRERESLQHVKGSEWKKKCDRLIGMRRATCHTEGGTEKGKKKIH